MPKKVLYFIIFLLLAVIFCIENTAKSDIVLFLPFLILHDVPLFYCLAVSFLLGMLVILPFVVFKGKKKTNKPTKKSESENIPEENAP
jgi:uncharacterized integral membrane protein